MRGQAIATRITGDPTNNGLFYLHGDHLGSTSLLTYGSSPGHIVPGTETRYLPYGTHRLAPTTQLTERDYTGQKENLELGLLYYNARFYVPGIGRFASADTIVPDPGNPQQLNRYAYVLGNPLSYFDPTGHSCALPESGDEFRACQAQEQAILSSTVQISIRAKVFADGHWLPFSIQHSHATLIDGQYLLTHNHWNFSSDLQYGNRAVLEEVRLRTTSGDEIWGNWSSAILQNMSTGTLLLDYGAGGLLAHMLGNRGIQSANALYNVRPSIGSEVGQIDWDGQKSFVQWATVIDDYDFAAIDKYDYDVYIRLENHSPRIGASGGGIYWHGYHIANNYSSGLSSLTGPFSRGSVNPLTISN